MNNLTKSKSKAVPYKKRTDTYASVRHSTQSSHAVPNTSERRDKNYATLYLFTIFCW